MTDGEFLRQVWPHLANSWSWSPGTEEREYWALRLQEFDAQAVILAVDQHISESPRNRKPNPQRLLTLCRSLGGSARSNRQAVYEEWFYGLSHGNQYRELLRIAEARYAKGQWENEYERCEMELNLKNLRRTVASYDKERERNERPKEGAQGNLAAGKAAQIRNGDP